MTTTRPVDHHVNLHLNKYLSKIEEALKADVLTIFSPILPGLEHIVKDAVESLQDRKLRLAVILDTLGGTIEVTERIVSVIRHHYNEIDFLIPDRAMSAGTVLVMAGDRIFMSYFSCLGPIDPQVYKNEEYVPASAYLNQYERLIEKADAGELNTVDFELLDQFDLGELYQFEQACELSEELLTNWLCNYKFKDWTDETGNPVSDEQKKQRAEEIATELGKNKRWHSHERMISRDTLTLDADLRLKIEKIEEIPGLFPIFDEYVELLKDYIQREQFSTFVHTRRYFL